MRTVTLDGFTFDDNALDGVRFTGQKLTGWNGAAGTNLSLTKKPRAAGAWRNTPTRNDRTIVFETSIRAASETAMNTALDAVNSLSTLDEVKLSVDTHGDTRWAMVSASDDVIVTDYPNPLYKRVSLQLAAADPRRFGDAMPASTGLPSTTGGLTLPITLPFNLGSTVVSGVCSLINPGNEKGPVTLRIDGDDGSVTGPIVTHVGSGLALVFSASLTITAGQWLDVDMEGQKVLLNGQASRARWVTKRGWSAFDPGQNTWAFTAISAVGTPTLSVTATPAWR